jgi:hypothetical protein
MVVNYSEKVGTFLFDRCKIDGFNGGWCMDIWPLIISWVADWCVVERFMIDIFLIGTFLFDRCKIDGFNGG